MNIKFFYRDREESYFAEAKQCGWLMTAVKDTNGDPLSAIHKRLNVIHFQVNVDFQTRKPKTPSIYGQYRIEIPVEYIFEKCPRLYFSDFFCRKGGTGVHHIALVATRPNTLADKFCQHFLVALDVKDNDFLRYFASSGRCSVLNNSVWTELLVTEDLNMKEMHDRWGVRVEKVWWKGNPRQGPRYKNPQCSSCSLSADPTFGRYKYR
jgi:hypothetical protein